MFVLVIAVLVAGGCEYLRVQPGQGSLDRPGAVAVLPR